jgi:hypothetical protein
MQCTLRLSITLSLDVPDATDPGFLSSLIGNNVGYRIFVRQRVDPNHIVVDLIGPGPDYRCRDVKDSISQDGRVQSINVLPQARSGSSSSR